MTHILRPLIVPALVLAIHAAAAAQGPLEKMDPALREIAMSLDSPAGPRLESHSDAGELALLVRGTPSLFRHIVESSGGRIGAVIGDVATVYMPATGLLRLAADASTIELEAACSVELYNDRAAESTGIARARRPVAEGGEDLTGRNVIVGLVDTGIDFTHFDFRDPQDTTRSRVHAIWDQNDGFAGERPTYGYGTIWRRSKLEAALRSGDWISVRHRDSVGHGTHTAGTAAGNGATLGRHIGMAPQSEIIMVSLNVARTTGLVDALDFIVRQADTLGRPVVINLSLGLSRLPHDGTSLVDVAIDNLVAEKPGRVICASAGNSGRSMEHWGARIDGDSAWTYVRIGSISDPLDTVLQIGVSAIVPVDDLPSLTVGIELDSAVGAGAPRPLRAWNATPRLQLSDVGVNIIPLPGTRTHPGASVYMYTSAINERERSLTIVLRDSVMPFADPVDPFSDGADAFRIVFAGRGSVHLWRSMGDTVAAAELTPRGLPGMRAWDVGWMVRSPGSARSAITVGALNNATRITNYLGETIDVSSYDSVDGALASFSTAGPTLDGRMKPDIVAPGLGVVSALSIWSYDALFGSPTIVEGARHISKSGTSMSCPVTVGAIALMLERYPNATSQQIKDAITAGARRDEHTASRGPLPNNFWGYGKLDLAGALRQMESGAAEPVEPSNRSPWAISFAKTSSGGTLRIDGTHGGTMRIVLVDALGRERAVLHDGRLPAGTVRVAVETEGLPAGMYFVAASDDTTSQCLKVTVP